MIQCGICRTIVPNGFPTVPWIDANEWSFLYMNGGNLLLCRKCTVVAMATLEATRQYIPNMAGGKPSVEASSDGLDSGGPDDGGDASDSGDECPNGGTPDSEVH